ncbi:MAG TPA: DUF2892 domain-containing protein [Ramlibacter sp.]|nr:DUF2892 domain-containing protein [Ramlibacter sp.]
MKTNIGALDRALRIGIGLLLLTLTLTETIGLWGYIGLLPLVTGLVATCPLYSLLGVRTCPRDAG